MTTYESLRRAQESLRLVVDARELGHLLWWTLNGSRVDHDHLVEAAERHGLDPKVLPAELKPLQAFRRAWRHAISKLDDGLMLRPIAETSEEIAIGLVRERPNEERRDLDYDHIGRIIFNKGQGTISADVEHRVVHQVRALFAHHHAHTTEDVRAMMTAFLSETAVSLRDAGGIWFVPAMHNAQLDALCRVVVQIGHNRTYRLPIIDSPSTRTTLREVAERTLDEEVRQLEDELIAFDFAKVRDSTLERRLEAFEQIRNRARLFAGVLSFKADALNERVSAMASQVRLHLGVDSEPAAPAADLLNASISASPTPQPFAPDVGF